MIVQYTALMPCTTPVDVCTLKDPLTRNGNSPDESLRFRRYGLLLRRVDDRIVALDIEAKQIPALHHVRRQRRRQIDEAAARMRHRDAPRQKVQAVLNAARQGPVLPVEIFWIADDR